MRALVAPREIGQKAMVIDSPHWQGSLQQFLHSLRAGVTCWVNSTSDGRRMLVEGGGKLTLADLAGYTPDCFLRGTSLGNALIDAGIVLCTITAIDTNVDDAIVDVDADTNLYEGG
ncbi:MAG: hypothetical protein AMXMBFR13_06690 [Phycisphaerae bacterium]